MFSILEQNPMVGPFQFCYIMVGLYGSLWKLNLVSTSTYLVEKKLILCRAPILVPLILDSDFDQCVSNDWFAVSMRWNNHVGLHDTLFVESLFLWHVPYVPEYYLLLFGNNQRIHNLFLPYPDRFPYETRVLHSFKRIIIDLRKPFDIRNIYISL